MVKKITIFTTNTCAYCGMVKKWLGTKGHQYEEINLDQFPNAKLKPFNLAAH